MATALETDMSAYERIRVDASPDAVVTALRQALDDYGNDAFYATVKVAA